MTKIQGVTLAILGLTLLTFAQTDVPTFKAEAFSALVWGEDSPSGAMSTSIQDPVTGNVIHRLSYDGINVSTRVGFEEIGSGKVGELLNFTATIVNNTDSELSLRQAGAYLDGHAASALSVALADKGLSKRQRKQVWQLEKMSCFSGGFLSRENFFQSNPSSRVFTVAPRTALTVSFVTKDPRKYSLHCTAEGCQPIGMMRFYVTVNTKDYVFVWPGSSAVYCGKNSW